MALVPLGAFLEPYRWSGVGCPQRNGLGSCMPLSPKAVYHSHDQGSAGGAPSPPDVAATLRLGRVSGDPFGATFSRTFAEFSADELPQKVHAAMIEQHRGSKLVGHVSRDATAIDGREKPVVKTPRRPAPSKKRGRPAKGEVRPPVPPTRLEHNLTGVWPRIWRICLGSVRWAAKRIAKAIRNLDRLQIAPGHH